MNGNQGKSLVNLRKCKQTPRLQHLLPPGAGAGLSPVSCLQGAAGRPALGDDRHFDWCPECLRRHPECLRPIAESVYEALASTAEAPAVSTRSVWWEVVLQERIRARGRGRRGLSADHPPGPLVTLGFLPPVGAAPRPLAPPQLPLGIGVVSSSAVIIQFTCVTGGHKFHLQRLRTLRSRFAQSRSFSPELSFRLWFIGMFLSLLP